MQLLYCLVPAIKDQYVHVAWRSVLPGQVLLCSTSGKPFIACTKTNVEAHKTIQNCGLVYSMDREKLHQLILRQDFVQHIPSDQMFIQVKWYSKELWLHYNEK